METAARRLFERYERFFNNSLGGNVDGDAIASLYASEFIAATPAGVMTGKNDDQLKCHGTGICPLSGDRNQGDADTGCPHLSDR